MIPIGDARRRFGFPWMTWLLLLISLALFVYEHISPPLSQALVYTYSFKPQEFAQRIDLVRLWTALTCLFLQGTSWLEPIVNLVYLWILGQKVEDACGPWGLLCLYLFGGIGGTISALLLHTLHPQGSDPVYGSAGVVAGLFGAYLILYRAAPIRSWFPPLIFARVPAVMHMLYWAGLVFVNLNFAAIRAGRFRQVFSFETSWPFVGALLVGLLAAHLFARREFLYYQFFQAGRPAR